MKKLLYLLSFISSFAFAQTTVRMSATATGTNTYSALFNPNVAAFNSSTIYVIPFTNANSSGTITLDPDSGGPGAAVSIKGDDGNDLAVGAIKAGGTYQFKFNGTLLRMIGSAGGDGWATTGTTPVTDPTIDFANSVLTLQGTGAAFSLDGGSGLEGLYYSAATTNLQITENLFEVGLSNGIVHFASGSGVGSDLQMTANFVVQAELDILLSAGTTGSGKDILLEAGSGTIDLTSDFLTINGSAGTATHVLTSNGAGAAPTWQAPAGGGWAVTGATNLVGDVNISVPTGQDLSFNSDEGDIDFGFTAGGVIIQTTTFKAGSSGDAAYFQATSGVSGDILATATDDVGISAGSTGSGHDVTIAATAGTINLNSDFLTINGSAGTSTHVLTSNGAGSAPTWQAAAGGSISDVAFGVGWDGNTTDGASKNALYDEIILKSPLASPTFTGTPTLPTGSIATTQSFGNNTTAIATTAFVQAAAGTWIDWSASLAPTGFSGTPTTVSYYIDDGKSVHIWIGVSGTSNATTMTVTLPVAPNAVYTANGIRWLAFVTNNGANATGRLLGSGSSTTLTIDANLTTGAWTASGTKALFCEFTYMK